MNKAIIIHHFLLPIVFYVPRAFYSVGYSPFFYFATLRLRPIHVLQKYLPSVYPVNIISLIL